MPLTVTFGVVAGLIALVFAVVAIGVGAPTVALVQVAHRGRGLRRSKDKQ